MSNYNYNTLCHHGIKGQKWGIRRYQNEDGTLTEEGKRKYGSIENLNKHRSNMKKVAIIGGTVAGAALAGATAYGIAKGREKKLSNEANRIAKHIAESNRNKGDGKLLRKAAGLSKKEYSRTEFKKWEKILDKYFDLAVYGGTKKITGFSSILGSVGGLTISSILASNTDKNKDQ